VIGSRADDTDPNAIVCVPAREAIETIEALAGVEVVAGTLAVDGKCLRFERDVHRTPPDLFFRGALLDDAFIFRRAAGLYAGVGYQRAVLGNMGIFFVENRVLVKSARWQIAMNFLNAKFLRSKIECVHGSKLVTRVLSSPSQRNGDAFATARFLVPPSCNILH
jgi:hypothetical protein